jgi:hypothetical protein
MARKSTKAVESEVVEETTPSAPVETETVEAPVAVVETISPYKATVRVNKRLAEEGLLPIKPQLLYGYVASDRIKAEKDENGKWKIALDVLDEWTDKYVANRKERNAKANRQVSPTEVNAENVDVS